MFILIKWKDGEQITQEIGTWRVKDNCLVVTHPQSNVISKNLNTMQGNTTYYPLYDIQEFTPLVS